MSSSGRRSVAVLFARHDSIYKKIRGCSVYDQKRDATTYTGSLPVIAHPPCRAWGGLRHMAKPLPGERELAIFALAAVRRCGGVLEHPARSELWPVMDLPMGDQVDEYGGFSLKIDQCWFGHLAEKSTLLYVVGVRREDVPLVTIDITAPGRVVGSSGRRLRPDGSRWRSDLSKRLREATPEPLARWLVALARRAVPRAVARRAERSSGRRPNSAGARSASTAEERSAQYVAERDAAAVLSQAQHGRVTIE